MSHLTRRLFSAGLVTAAGAGLSGCAGTMRDMPVFGGMFGDGGTTGSLPSGRTISQPDYAKTYAGIEGERFPVAPFRFSSVDPRFLRQEVVYTGLEKPGTIVVDPRERHLYHVGEKNRATRYGVGVGREGFSWSGVAQINMKRDWPDWVPPSEMVARDPDIQAQLRETSRGQGVPGGVDNPLGARAMYLFAEGGDTGFRIHGTTEPETIGQDVSSGCVRMVNQDVIHLYHRSPQGAKVVVLG